MEGLGDFIRKRQEQFGAVPKVRGVRPEMTIEKACLLFGGLFMGVWLGLALFC